MRTHRWATAASAMIVATTIVSVRAEPALAADPCTKTVYLLTDSSTEGAVTTEMSYTGDGAGMLRARGGSDGPWERFLICWPDSGSNTVVIRSEAANRWVSVEKDMAGGNRYMLRARATTIGPWEEFDIFSTQDCKRVMIRSKVGGFVSVERNYTGGGKGMLRARATTIGPWEKFVVMDANGAVLNWYFPTGGGEPCDWS